MSKPNKPTGGTGRCLFLLVPPQKYKSERCCYLDIKPKNIFKTKTPPIPAVFLCFNVLMFIV